MVKQFTVPVLRATAASFAPFGHVIARPDGPPGFAGVGYSTWRYPIRMGSGPDLTLLRHQYRRIACTRLERHPHMTELRVPLDHLASIIFVAASKGPPEAEEVQGFLVDGDVAVLIGTNCWHSSSFVFDPRGADFILVSDLDTEAELEAMRHGTPTVHTHVRDWTGEAEFLPDLSGFGQPWDQNA